MRLPSAIQRRTWARRLLVVWAQVFVVLPALHLHDHSADHHHGGGGITWHGEAHYPHAEELPHAHADEHLDQAEHADQPQADQPQAEQPSVEHLGHDADGSAAHLSAAILPPGYQPLCFFRPVPIDGPRIDAHPAAPRRFDGFLWSARAPPA